MTSNMVALHPRLAALLSECALMHGSDLHLQVGYRPRVRVLGELVELSHVHTLERDAIDHMSAEIIGHAEKDRLERERALGVLVVDAQDTPWRATFFYECEGLAAAFRRLSRKIPKLAELALPQAVERFSRFKSGLCLFTGASGMGKTTTMAAVVDAINEHRAAHIVTVEDPIEYIHPPRAAMIQQRGLGQDAASFAQAIAEALGDAPDVLVIGEILELATARLALQAANQGVLVFGTLHTIDAARTVERLVDMFPPEEQSLARGMLSRALRAVISQRLVRSAQDARMVPVAEILFSTPAVASLIREGKTHEIESCIQTGGQRGMVTVESSLQSLVQQRVISEDHAEDHRRSRGR